MTRRLRTTSGGVALALLGAMSACGDAPESIRFVALGDLGTGGPGQRRVAAAVAERARERPIDFMLTLGDNFYPAGVLSTDDPLWSSIIEDVYSEPLGVPIRPTLGNHDHQGFPLAQVDYSDRSDTWAMPAPYYTFTEELRDGSEVAFFALDTEMIRTGLTPRRDPGSLGRREARVRGALVRHGASVSDDLVRHIAEQVHENDEFTVSRIVRLARRTERPIDERLVREAIRASVPEDHRAQLEWLDRALAESTARWKIVFGHHPLYGHERQRGHLWPMIDRVEGILVERDVDLYVAGHDHLLDMMKPIRGVHYLTSGGGAGDDNPYPIDRTDESYYIATGGGFSLLTVTAEQIEIELVDADGVTHHTHVFRE